jgi:gas vesicle protein
MADDDATGGGFVTGLLLGLLAGVTLAMIAAPHSGEDTREVLRAKAREAGNQALEGAGAVSDAVTGTTNALLERGRAIVESARARVDGAVAEGMEAADQTRNELQSRT